MKPLHGVLVVVTLGFVAASGYLAVERQRLHVAGDTPAAQSEIKSQPPVVTAPKVTPAPAPPQPASASRPVTATSNFVEQTRKLAATPEGRAVLLAEARVHIRRRYPQLQEGADLTAAEAML